MLSRLITTALVLSSCVWADVVYTSPAAFAAATVNPTVIGFNGILAPGQTFAGFNPLLVAGNSFSTPNAATFVNVTAADFYGPGFTYPADFIVNSSNPGDNELDVTLANPTLALALDYGGFNGGGLGTITLSDGTVFLNSSLTGLANTAFVGFVSTTPITGFTFVATNDAWVALDVITASPVPEPASYWLLGLAVMGLIARRSANTRSYLRH